ncbi:sulfurtransferase TusA family protein [Roseococcus pinisoli]|uniref:Sulfurtransferase TusA family protein n=1 Tax=Roseococcus pinisoli TaxID=2835040 RepID=A0ABS5Q9G4_9PROT|nr:sulfurtransferase TusA family protein [Roseococcus pinisoli]MBS7810336.1 sulfurtransferase TusA family protein [Roseococcus pinisoli]
MMTTSQLVDVSADTCPMTFVRARLRLDRMQPGEVLEVRFKGDEPRDNLPRSFAEQGHSVLVMEFNEDGSGKLLVKKGG